MSEQLLGLSFRQYKSLRNQMRNFRTKITIKLRNFQYYALSLVSYEKICVSILSISVTFIQTFILSSAICSVDNPTHFHWYYVSDQVLRYNS